MSSKKILLLNQAQIHQKINRIAYQILEDNLDEKEIIIAGIFKKGYAIAQQLAESLQPIGPFKTTLIQIDITRTDTHPKASTQLDMADMENKVIVLVDDVLNTGRTMAYSLGLFLQIPIKKLRTVVLIDRSHRTFPVSPSFTGLKLATVLHEYIEVVLSTENKVEAVFLS